MRINPISVTPCINMNKKNVQFQGKHDCAKVLGGIAGGLGTLGAIGGIAIMTGGISLIPTIAYGALCGGLGAGVGHMIDKSQPDYNKK